MTKIGVVLATYNGEEFIEDQLISIVSQKGVQIDWILINDDGSSDNTLSVIYNLQKRFSFIKLLQSNDLGPRKAFFHLLNNIPSTGVDYVALSDQDDIWLPGKLFEAIGEMKKTRASLSISSVISANFQTHHYDTSGYDEFLYSFSQALVRNNAIGMTMVLDAELVSKLRLPDGSLSEYVLHDWWIYVSALALGKTVTFIDNPGVLYRQHGKNVVGGDKMTKFNWMKRQLKNVKSRKNVRKNLATILLQQYRGELTELNAEQLVRISEYQSLSVVGKYDLVKHKVVDGGSFKRNVLLMVLLVTNNY